MELSEPATAVALLLRDSLPNLNGKDQKLLEKWWKSKKWQKALLSKKIEMSGNDLSATKKGLSDKEVKGGKDLKTALTNAAVGISAAKSIVEWMAKDHGKKVRVENYQFQKFI